MSLFQPLVHGVMQKQICQNCKRKNLIRHGVNQGDAYAWSRSRKGGWAIAQSPIMGTTITIDRLMKRGYEPMLVYYTRIHPNYKDSIFPSV